MPQPLAVQRVLGDRPFAEIGEPRAVAVDENRGLIAIGGQLGWLHWVGAYTAHEGWAPHVLGIYDRPSLRCRMLLHTEWPIRSLDFHPRQPLLAIGTGSYDGGWHFYGEVLLLHLDTGELVSPLADSREVRRVRWRTWRHGRVLDLALAPPDDWEYGNDAMRIGYDAMVVRDDWLAVQDNEIADHELDGPLRDSDIVTSEQARAAVEALSTQWSYRGPVWAVEHLHDGRILATMDGAGLECWLPTGELAWSVVEESGRQLVVAADRESALVAIQTPELTIDIARHSLRDGELMDRFNPVGVVTARADGVFALRPVAWEAQPTTVFRADGTEIGQVALGGFQLASYSFPVRHASALYFLREPGEVVVVGDDLAVRRLFDGAEAGPAVEVGNSLVCCCLDSTVMRRRLPDGEIVWRLEVDRRVTALEVDGSMLYVALNSGALLGVNVDTGELRWRQELSVHGQPTTGLSLASPQPGRLLIGTTDGRILDCS
ncbi:PQQ-binding-like beta-propeller repeat protein [Amycolatopsis taiwanensis]|uniref:Pyrrolo-quinoline quinone repeat domain-containing protein n=1 Tax=Amycolatopsis taiwanensis TaxID=342230 RepID=A0A9W6R1G7_9PSEU|nr:PQQ-binding-like beta-propeller repeat protein [Amycolatopsis taiwanensis]GLY66643.1 hypothetical protein Atai01_32620 [Amycolatopsis taiwanensis]